MTPVPNCFMQVKNALWMLILARDVSKMGEKTPTSDQHAIIERTGEGEVGQPSPLVTRITNRKPIRRGVL